MPNAWNMGRIAKKISLRNSAPCIHASPCKALEYRLKWVSMAPLGRPVVPEVYWMAARSSTDGRGCSGSMGPWVSRSFQGMVPGAGPVSASRDSRRLFTGRYRARRLRVGNASRRLTETILVDLDVGREVTDGRHCLV